MINYAIVFLTGLATGVAVGFLFAVYLVLGSSKWRKIK